MQDIAPDARTPRGKWIHPKEKRPGRDAVSGVHFNKKKQGSSGEVVAELPICHELFTRSGSEMC